MIFEEVLRAVDAMTVERCRHHRHCRVSAEQDRCSQTGYGILRGEYERGLTIAAGYRCATEAGRMLKGKRRRQHGAPVAPEVVWIGGKHHE